MLLFHQASEVFICGFLHGACVCVVIHTVVCMCLPETWRKQLHIYCMISSAHCQAVCCSDKTEEQLSVEIHAGAVFEHSVAGNMCDIPDAASVSLLYSPQTCTSAA